jgi:hypothetical protein
MAIFTEDQLLLFNDALKRMFRSQGIQERALPDNVIDAFLDSFTSDYNSLNPLTLGRYTFWIDSSGQFRFKFGLPSTESDGLVLGR